MPGHAHDQRREDERDHDHQQRAQEERADRLGDVVDDPDDARMVAAPEGVDGEAGQDARPRGRSGCACAAASPRGGSGVVSFRSVVSSRSNASGPVGPASRSRRPPRKLGVYAPASSYASPRNPDGRDRAYSLERVQREATSPMRTPATLVFCAALLAPFLQVRPAHALPAFPGAQGFGTETTGGRHGVVLVVTTLAGSGPGSFRAAMMSTGAADHRLPCLGRDRPGRRHRPGGGQQLRDGAGAEQPGRHHVHQRLHRQLPDQLPRRRLPVHSHSCAERRHDGLQPGLQPRRRPLRLLRRRGRDLRHRRQPRLHRAVVDDPEQQEPAEQPELRHADRVQAHDEHHVPPQLQRAPRGPLRRPVPLGGGRLRAGGRRQARPPQQRVLQLRLPADLSAGRRLPGRRDQLQPDRQLRQGRAEHPRGLDDLRSGRNAPHDRQPLPGPLHHLDLLEPHLPAPAPSVPSRHDGSRGRRPSTRSSTGPAPGPGTP